MAGYEPRQAGVQHANDLSAGCAFGRAVLEVIDAPASIRIKTFAGVGANEQIQEYSAQPLMEFKHGVTSSVNR